MIPWGRAARLAVPGVLALLAAGAVAAGEAPPSGEAQLREELEAEREARARLEAELGELRGMVEALREGREQDREQIEELRSSIRELEGRRPDEAEPRPEPQRRAEPQAEPGPQAGTEVARAEPREPAPDQVGVEKREDRKYQDAERQILEQRRGVLLPGGQLVVEPGFQYTNISRNRVQLSGFSLIPAIIIGRIDVADVDRNIYQGFLNGRYGLTDWLEGELQIPFVGRSDDQIIGVGGNEEPSEDHFSGAGIGDVSGGLFAQVLYEQGWIPDTVLSLRFNAPTGEDFTEVDDDELPVGSGFWGVQGGVTVTKTVDPAVLFGSLRYTGNLPDEKMGVVFDPGDTIEYSGGLAFSLNERLAMSMSFQHRITDKIKADGEKILRTDANAAALFLGGSYTLSRWTALTLNVGIGLTEDAPDFQVEVRMPIRMPFRLPVLDIPPPPALFEEAKALGRKAGEWGRRVGERGREKLFD